MSAPNICADCGQPIEPPNVVFHGSQHRDPTTGVWVDHCVKCWMANHSSEGAWYTAPREPDPQGNQGTKVDWRKVCSACRPAPDPLDLGDLFAKGLSAIGTLIGTSLEALAEYELKQAKRIADLEARLAEACVLLDRACGKAPPDDELRALRERIGAFVRENGGRGSAA